MAMYRHQLPQHGGGLFLTDAGLETDLIFNRGVDVPHFAAHTLLAHPEGRAHLADYFRGFLALAWAHGTGFVLDTPTWKAHAHWADELGASEQQLREANRDAVAFALGLRNEFLGEGSPIVLNAIVGPRGDAYAPQSAIGAGEAEDYHAQQLGWLAETQVDMVSAMTFTQSAEAIGFLRAARAVDLPAVVSFTVETDGALPTGQGLADAIIEVDAATRGSAAYFMINCAHPDHFDEALNGSDWLRRIRGLRCNASRRSHAELDACTDLDAGDPGELAQLYGALVERMPWVNVIGGCCGSDLRHVAEIAATVGGATDLAVGA